MPHAIERCYSRAHPYRCSNPWDTPLTKALLLAPLAARTPSAGAVRQQDSYETELTVAKGEIDLTFGRSDPQSIDNLGHAI
jgi:hypothetical protein